MSTDFRRATPIACRHDSPKARAVHSHFKKTVNRVRTRSGSYRP
jgi:hypothetical protein